MFARFAVFCGSSPMVVSVYATPGSFSISALTRVAITRVPSRLVPSGARMMSANCDSSSVGRKLMFVRGRSTPSESIAPTQASTMAQRCAMDQRSIVM
jgi:hypothetical protein